MPVSVFEIFKPGIGPSSSHTMGPMVAATRFLDELRGGAERIPGAGEVASVRVSLHGSLAFTGKGHASDRAVVLGLLGQRPETLDPDAAEELIEDLRQTRTLHPEGLPPLDFDPAADLLFDFGPALPLHANGMIFRAFDRAGNPFLTTVYYSVGGGFVQTEAELLAARDGASPQGGEALPHPFRSARDMLEMGRAAGLSIAAMTRANEVARGVRDLDARLDALSETVNACIDRGLSQ